MATSVPYSNDFGLRVARGMELGHRAVYKYGHNEVVGTSEETLWAYGGAYSFPGSASVMKVTSDDDVEDADGGTGALTVVVEGLDSDYNEVSETITMTGQTAANTTNTYIRVHRAYVATAGSTGSNVGVIYVGTGTVTDGVPANIYTTIEAAEGQTLQCFYTIPANYTGYLADVALENDGVQTVDITLRMRPNGGAWRNQDNWHIDAGALQQVYPVPRKFEEKTDIKMQAVAGGASASVSGSFTIILVADTVGS